MLTPREMAELEAEDQGSLLGERGSVSQLPSTDLRGL